MSAVSAIVEEIVDIPVERHSLEGTLAYPAEGEPETTVLLLTPHPHFGGNMENNLIRHLARRFAEEGCATLRFNYRGIGNSTSEIPERVSLFDYWAEIERGQRYDELMPDVEAADRFLRDTIPSAAGQILIGYSLGAILGLKLAQAGAFTHVVGISPPVLKATLPPVVGPSTSFLFVGGEKDFAFDPDVLASILGASEDEIPLERIPSCDHFYRKREEEVHRIVSDWSRTVRC